MRLLDNIRRSVHNRCRYLECLQAEVPVLLLPAGMQYTVPASEHPGAILEVEFPVDDSVLDMWVSHFLLILAPGNIQMPAPVSVSQCLCVARCTLKRTALMSSFQYFPQCSSAEGCGRATGPFPSKCRRAPSGFAILFSVWSCMEVLLLFFFTVAATVCPEYKSTFEPQRLASESSQADSPCVRISSKILLPRPQVSSEKNLCPACSTFSKSIVKAPLQVG